MQWSYKTKAQKLDDRIEKECHWHKWFAWTPVKITHIDGTQRKAWLEYVGRKRKKLSYQSEFGEQMYLGGDEYCDQYDILPKALVNNEIVDHTSAARLGEFMGGSTAPPQMPVRRVSKNGP